RRARASAVHDTRGVHDGLSTRSHRVRLRRSPHRHEGLRAFMLVFFRLHVSGCPAAHVSERGLRAVTRETCHPLTAGEPLAKSEWSVDQPETRNPAKWR